MFELTRNSHLRLQVCGVHGFCRFIMSQLKADPAVEKQTQDRSFSKQALSNLLEVKTSELRRRTY